MPLMQTLVRVRGLRSRKKLMLRLVGEADDLIFRSKGSSAGRWLDLPCGTWASVCTLLRMKLEAFQGSCEAMWQEICRSGG